jgi:Tfp pilus assembly major pilin PilA
MIWPGWTLKAKALPWGTMAIGVLMVAICGLLVDRYFTRAELAEVQADNAALRQNIEILKTDASAKEQAAQERAADAATNANLTKELTDAIAKAPSGAQPGPASIALNCQRLRRAGRTEAGLPEPCRSSR